MALSAWSVVARERDVVAMRRDDATLIVEAPRPAEDDPDLRAAIARLAPQLRFAEMIERRAWHAIERAARDADGRWIAVGRVGDGARTIAYLVGAPAPVDVSGVVAELLGASASTFAHFAD